MGTPISTSSPPFQVYPSILVKNVDPPPSPLLNRFLEGPTPPIPFNKGMKGGVPTMFTAD